MPSQLFIYDNLGDDIVTGTGATIFFSLTATMARMMIP